jgi:hypothetical protein
VLMKVAIAASIALNFPTKNPQPEAKGVSQALIFT